MTFNRNLAHQMYGVTNEKDLRDKLYGTRTDLTDPEFETIVESCISENHLLFP